MQKSHGTLLFPCSISRIAAWTGSWKVLPVRLALPNTVYNKNTFSFFVKHKNGPTSGDV